MFAIVRRLYFFEAHRDGVIVAGRADVGYPGEGGDGGDGGAVVVVEGKRRHREAISRSVRRLAGAEDVGGGDLDVSNLRVGVRGGERGVDEHGGDRGTIFGEGSGG